MSQSHPSAVATSQPSEQSRRRASLWSWVGEQVVAALWLLAQLVIGPVLAMIRRRFHWRAFLAGFGTLLVGTAALAALLWADPMQLGARRQDVLWPAVLVVATVAGFVTGRVGRRVGGWEIYVALLLTTGLYVVHLAKGWHVLLGFGGTDIYSTWDLTGLRPLGEQYFGELWTRLIALVAIGALVLAIFGGSVAFLLYSEGRLDRRFALEWFVSRRHLAREGRGMVSVTAAVAVAGIALGVGALVAVTAVMSGYQEDIREKILSTNAHLVIQKYGLDFSEYESVGTKMKAVPGVLAASPFVFNEAMLSDGERGLGVLVKGVAPKTAATVTGVEQNLCLPELDGRCHPLPKAERAGKLGALLSPAGGAAAIILGYDLYKRVGKPVGSVVSLTTPVGIASARGSAPRRMQFLITGVFRSGMHEFDNRLAYVALPAAQHLLGMNDSVNGVELRVADPERVDLVAKAALRVLGRYPYHSLDWRELNSGIFTALNLQKIVMFLVLTFIIVVAAFNIASTLFMAVVERAHEIGVLKSMGARDASVMKVFVLQGWVVGLVGTALGVAIGLAVCAILAEVGIGIAADVYMVDSLKVRVWPLEILTTVGATLIISHLASIYPALKAARQHPVDAMRYD
jgi:lipoprotein-releasing system permease protein